ncbi:MAG: hypothetical protein RQ757_05915 [Pseudomonadales bacterium]|nr:hypothetical protein [Pseudomonadales bacterium]
MLSKTLPLLLALVLAGCNSFSRSTPKPTVPLEPPIPAVGNVSLHTATQLPAEHELLEIGIVVFDLPAQLAGQTRPGESLYREIAEKEAQYLPYVLRNTLVESNQWGPVRVLPEADPSVDLNLAGTILSSTGLTLELQVKVTDSTGRLWLDKTYRDVTTDQDYPGRDPFLRSFASEEELADNLITDTDPFADIYRQIANDLLAMRNTMEPAELENVSLVSQMLYAAELSEATFGRTLERGEDGLLRVTSLLARDDPMLQRVETIKLRHHLFIDTVDEYYESLYQQMQPSYALWRRYSRDEAIEDKTQEQRTSSRADPESGSFLALSQSYNRYKWAKLFEQEFMALAAGFNNEVAPAILELNRRVHGLSGTLEEQYRQWREILRQIFELESGDQVSR